MTRGLVSTCIVFALGSVECSATAVDEGSRRIAVRGVAEDVIVPTLADLARETDELVAALQAFTVAPDLATLDAAQAAWREARVPWKHAGAFAFGPSETLRLGADIDQFPVEPSKIAMELSGTEVLTEQYVSSIGADRRGFHGIEYLLFYGDDGDEDAVVLTSYTDDPLAARRKELVVAMAQSVAASADALLSAWVAADDAYVDVFLEPGVDNETYPTLKSVVDALVNESLYLAELVADARLGKPLGLASGGAPQPDLEESAPSDNSVADMTASLESIAYVYTGSGTPDLARPPTAGIGMLVRLISGATDVELRDAIQAALSLVAAIPRPFKRALVEHRDACMAAYDAIKNLKSLIGTEVVTALGVTLKFNDNDGD
jgi:uncharacterized protein